MIKAKKKYGQNFLKDQDAISKIIEAIPNNKNKIVEIGPGLGDLTKFIVKRKDVIAYEVDSELYEYLYSEFKDEIKNEKLKILLGDVLSFWEQNRTLFDGKYDLIANLPYYIATNIILKALDDSNCENIIVMVQKEVAQKFISSVSDSDYCGLSVITALISLEAQILFDLPPSSFLPPPKVTSSVIWIKKKKNISLDDNFNKFLKLCFTQPRKTLVKNLSGRYDRLILEQILLEFDLSFSIRPHELSPSLFSLLYERIIKDDRKYTGATSDE